MADASGRTSPSQHPGATTTLRLGADESGSTTARLRPALEALLAPGPAAVVVDLSDRAVLSSDVVDVLLWLRRRCADRAVRVVVRRPSRRSMDVLRASGLLAWLAVEDAPSPQVGHELR